MNDPGGRKDSAAQPLGVRNWFAPSLIQRLPIVFAGLLLGDDELANINKSFPKVSFGEDKQTAYGDCWTGAKVVFAGNQGIKISVD